MRTTITETVTLSDAAAMVEVALTELNRGGFAEQANTLRGLEIFSREDAQYAVVRLTRMKLTGNKDVDAQVRYAVATLTSVITASASAAHAC